MTITTNDDRNEFTATGGQTVFSYTFKIYASTDLNVYQTPAGQDFNDSTDLITGYTVSGVGNSGGGSITLNSGATSGDRITIVSDIPSSRTTDYKVSGDFTAGTVNEDIDRVVSLQKQAEGIARRSLLFPQSQQNTTSLTLPKPTSGNFLKWKTDLSGLENHTFSASGIQSDVSVSDYAALRALDSSTYSDGQVIFVTNDGIAGQFVVKTGTVTDNNATRLVFTDDSNRYVDRIITNGEYHAAWWGVAAGGSGLTSELQSATDYISASAPDSKLIVEPGVYGMDARYTLKSNVNLYCPGPGYAELDFDGVLGVSSGESRCVSGENISNVIIEGFLVSADVTSFTNNGFDTYGMRIDGSSNVHLKRVKVKDQEWGALFRNGCTDCSMEDVVAEDCYYHSIGSFGTSVLPNQRLTFKKILAYSNGTNVPLSTSNASPVSGFNSEETYDSEFDGIVAYNCGAGVRIENSCDNNISNIRAYENWSVGLNIYNLSQRNNISNVNVWDNNRQNDDATDTTNRGNDNTLLSGINVEVGCYNNNFSNISSYQTPAAEVPFNSGSDEPAIGSKLRGATSGATGRVQRITLDSGSWGGGDAAGTIYLVETTGSFNSSETIENITTVVPYNSGGTEKPLPGNVLTGAISGASGTVLWESQQSGVSGDWSIGNSDGNIYLIDVTGTFNASENLNNTTTGTSNIATTNGAATAVDSDIATSNGSFVAATGSNKGFQRYGVGINIRNYTSTATASSYNNFMNVQCFNNALNDFEDRGFYNKLNNFTSAIKLFTRNA